MHELVTLERPDGEPLRASVVASSGRFFSLNLMPTRDRTPLIVGAALRVRRPAADPVVGTVTFLGGGDWLVIVELATEAEPIGRA